MEYYYGIKIFFVNSHRLIFIRFCSKLINIAVPKTIDERAINLNFSKQDIFRQSENLELGKVSTAE